VTWDLPLGCEPSDISDLAGFELDYDVNIGRYTIRKEVHLLPKGVETFRIVMPFRLWSVSKPALEDLSGRANRVARTFERIFEDTKRDFLVFTWLEHKSGLQRPELISIEEAVSELVPVDQVPQYSIAGDDLSRIQNNHDMFMRLQYGITQLENLAAEYHEDSARVLLSWTRSGSELLSIPAIEFRLESMAVAERKGVGCGSRHSTNSTSMVTNKKFSPQSSAVLQMPQ
jgi:hypothetical protein